LSNRANREIGNETRERGRVTRDAGKVIGMAPTLKEKKF